MQSKFKEMNDVELYDMLRAGKKDARKAFDELYERHSQRIYTYCKKILMNQTSAEDVFQEVFTKLYINSQKNVQINNVFGFLLTVARNLSINEASRKKETVASEDEMNLMYFDNQYENKDISEILNQAIQSLPEQFREVLILKENMDMTYAEIAEVRQQPLSTVRVNIYRAKEKLREILSPYLDQLKD